jgi:protoporphyrinogen/coproporphyrinogen III oxidase
MKKIKCDVVIAGAGLTGLTAGFYLNRRGKDILILDTSGRTGGVINTVSEEGFTYETGPNTGVLSTPEIAVLFDDLGDSCRLERATPTANSRWIWKGDRWVPLPGGLVEAITTPLFTFKDKLRILGEPFRGRGTDRDESVASLVKRRMGNSYLDYAVDPFISGIYAGNPEHLITRHALPKLYNLERQFGSFIRGGVVKSFQKKSVAESRATKEVFSVAGGLSSMTTALANTIGNDKIILSCKDVQSEHEGKTFTTTFSCGGIDYIAESDYLVTTCGSQCLRSLLSFADERELNAIMNLEYARVVQVIAGYKTWAGIPLNGFGGLVPSKENRDILGVLFTSSFLNDRAPEKGALLSFFMGGARKPGIVEKSDSEITSIALREADAMLGCRNQNPDLLKVFRYKYAIPQYAKSTDDRLAAIDRLEGSYPGLILAGNIKEGIGMADRVKQGVRIADQIAPFDRNASPVM